MTQRLWRLIVIQTDWVSMSLSLHICINVYRVLYTCMYGECVCACVRACVRACVCVQLKLSITDASIQSFYLQEIPHQLEVHTRNIVLLLL